MAKTFNFDDFASQAGRDRNPNCVACEEMITDALDGVLSPADQTFFDQHVSGCVSCMNAFSDAKRGAAWLDILKVSRPEPSSDLLARILADTSSQAPQAFNESDEALVAASLPYLPTNVLPFVARPAQVSRFTRFTRIAMEPRLAMTAAMAFFSIALTMNLLGVHLNQMNAEDLKPSNLKRTYFAATATGHRYYDNLRVVRVLESRVDDLRQNSEEEPGRPSFGSQSQPSQSPSQSQPQTQPQPDTKPAAKPDAPHGSSRNDAPLPQAPTVLRSSSAKPTEDSSAHFAKEGGLA